jgi:hypothetical protein
MVHTHSGASSNQDDEEYRAARVTPWGSALPAPFLVELLSRLDAGLGDPYSYPLGGSWRSRFRLVSVDWKAAHDQHCPRLKLRKLGYKMPPSLPCFPSVTSVKATTLRTLFGLVNSGLCSPLDWAFLPKLLQRLPSLTELELQIPDALCTADTTALQSLTTLTSLKLYRTLDVPHEELYDLYPHQDNMDY